MTSVISKDGTSIASLREGSGPPLVLVHGTGGSSARWVPLLPMLTPHFSVVAIDRRGRGDSGDTPPYSIQREFEDIAAVIDSLDEPAYLLGHSFGGICSLEAALLTTNLRKLVIYEAPIPASAERVFVPEVFERLKALLEADDREAVLTVFMREVNHMPAHEFEIFRSSSAWASRVAAAHTLPRELKAAADYHYDPARWSAFHVPTLLMLGGDSSSYFRAAINALHDALPDNRVVVLPGQQHVAMDTAPNEWIRAVVQFLTELLPDEE
jgi:pimeloyl-ACP methyl ester carboxylesterase